MHHAAIEIRKVSKTYPGKKAVDRLDLSIPTGSVFALLGDNGAGKSTTIRMLNGLTPPDSGKITILGRDAWKDAWLLRQRIGFVPERPKFYDWMTVAELGWFASGFHRPGYLQRYFQWTEQFLLDPQAKLSTLSKGQYAKVGLSVALAIDPEVLILDEPTSGLDLLVRREFLASMVRLAGQGKTILISSHQIAEIERVASHVAFLAKGRLVLTAPMAELRDLVVRVRFRCDNPPGLDTLGIVLQEQSVGGKWQVVLRAPQRENLDELHRRSDVREYEEVPLSLEETYCALLGKQEAVL